MPAVAEFDGIRILFYCRDHDPAHFHVEFGEVEALIRILDLSMMEGELPSRVSDRVLAWARPRRAGSALNWIKRGGHVAPDRLWRVVMPGSLANRIEGVETRRGLVVVLRWAGGMETVRDMAPTVAGGGVFAPLADEAAFALVSVGPRGRSLVWPGAADIDALWFEAHPEDNPYTTSSVAAE